MGGDPIRVAPYQEAAALYDYHATCRAWVEGEAALRGIPDLRALPGTLYLHVLYSLAVRDSKDAAEKRQRLDEHLTSLNAPTRATWGLLPSHQARMGRAAQAGSR